MLYSVRNEDLPEFLDWLFAEQARLGITDQQVFIAPAPEMRRPPKKLSRSELTRKRRRQKAAQKATEAEGRRAAA